MTRRITNTLTYFSENQDGVSTTRMVLQPSTFNFREQFRDAMAHQLLHSTRYRIPWVEQMGNTEVLDSEGVININNRTSSEERIELMQNILNYQNNQEISLLLIRNSSLQVRTYLHDLLIRSSNDLNISEEDLYRIGNIFLYTRSNLDIDELVIRDFIQNMRKSMVVYNNN
nr:ORF170 [Phytophthora infestans]ADK36697.1 unknown [Phytophthora infestans]ADZ32023.1 ORF170 [Phytophthora infestans]ADZ32031.1 ORF170 [Phytophthora infestans]ADZ32047.1 ORF170 [Phytophthora infestans]